MKKIFSTIILVLIAGLIFSQQQAGIIEYDVIINVENTIKCFAPDAKIDTYAWRDEWKIRKSKAEFKFSPKETLYTPIADENDQFSRSNEYILYTNVEKSRICNLIRTMGKLYVIEDSLPKVKWKVTNAMKKVCGHICMSAIYTDTLKNVEATAWFALDLPLPYGPDIYTGLPGLVLEVDLCNGTKVYTAKKITLTDEFPDIDKPKYKKKTSKVNYTEYQKILYDFIQDSKKRPGMGGMMMMGTML